MDYNDTLFLLNGGGHLGYSQRNPYSAFGQGFHTGPQNPNQWSQPTVVQAIPVMTQNPNQLQQSTVFQGNRTGSHNRRQQPTVVEAIPVDDEYEQVKAQVRNMGHTSTSKYYVPPQNNSGYEGPQCREKNCCNPPVDEHMYCQWHRNS